MSIWDPFFEEFTSVHATGMDAEIRRVAPCETMDPMSDLSKPNRIRLPASLVMPGDEVEFATGRIRRVVSKEWVGEYNQTILLHFPEGVSLQRNAASIVEVIPR